MITIREYKKVQSLEEAYELNQKKSNRIIGGMIWLKMETLNVGTASNRIRYPGSPHGKRWMPAVGLNRSAPPHFAPQSQV